MGEEFVQWVEPYDESAESTVICRMTKEDVVKAQRKTAIKLYGHDYNSDEEALHDFMVVHWAKIVYE